MVDDDTIVTSPPAPPAFLSMTTGTGLTAASPVEAMRIEEVGRLRAMVRVMRWLSVGLLATLPLFGGHTILRYALLAGIALGIPMGWWFERVIARPGGFTRRRITLAALGLGANAYLGILYFGTFSAAVSLVVMSLFLTSRTEFLRSALVLYMLCAIAQAAFGALIIGGVIDDPGLVQVTDRPTHEQVIMLVMIEAVYLFAYLIGRASRAMALDAIDKLEGARRQVIQRDALLHEAHQDLDQAQHVDAPGRYSERTIGSFRLGDVIGRGAMAEVYEAHHVDTGEPAAVKLLHPSMQAQPRAVARFLREARAASAIASNHVARVLEASSPDDSLPFLAMERLFGNDLAHFLRRKPTMPLGDVVVMVRQVASVIDQAAAAGVVHRDLKPQNLFLAQDGDRTVWKVLDFGVSVLAEGSGTLTQGHVVGTPSYMSPEQARGAGVDRRTDIHALAAIAYRCITGRPPFVGPDIPSVLYAAVHTMPEQPSAILDVPEDVDAALAIGLAKNRERRFERAEDFAVALEAASRGELEQRWIDRANALLADMPWGARG